MITRLLDACVEPVKTPCRTGRHRYGAHPACAERRRPHAATGRQLLRLRHPGDLLRPGHHHRRARPARDRDQRGLPALRAITARVGDRPGLHLGQPRRDRDPRHGRQRRAVRPADRALLLDRRRAGHGVPRPGDDAVLLRLARPQRAGVPAAPVQPGHAPVQRGLLRRRRRADRGRQPLRAGAGHQRADRLADLALDRHLGRVRARLHHPRRAVRRDLQRGAAVLRHHRRPDPARGHRPQGRRRLGRPAGQDRPQHARARRLLDLGRHPRRPLDEPAR